MDTTKLLFKVPEAADAIGVSRAKAYDLINRGLIPSIRLGGSLRVPVDGLRQWIADQSRKSETDAA